jgi:FlaA1/EpsC-like NDP-sugar epimerase
VIANLASVHWHRFLRRPALPAPSPQTLQALRKERILVTGAGGSIGSALVLRLANLRPAELIVLEACESRLSQLQAALTDSGTTAPLQFALGNVGDADLLRELFAASLPTTVFHAAAYKHVPLLEEQPFAAVENNLFATATLTAIASEFGARLLLLSTDKAVLPASILGATKSAAERVVTSAGGTVVRLGNVLGSSGSVAEVFVGQLAEQATLTVTDPLARRYFLTMEEAVNLLISASIDREPSNTFVPALSQEHFITDLADFVAQEFAPGQKLRIEFTGARPGDKECEQLWSPPENTSAPDARGLIRIDTPRIDSGLLRSELSELRSALQPRDLPGLLLALGRIVPDYVPSSTILDRVARAAAPTLP